MLNLKKSCWLTTVLVLSLAMAAFGAEPKQSQKTDARVMQILDGLSNRFKDVRTASGEFVQVKRSKTFREESESKGKFWYGKPDQFRCDYKGGDDSEEMTNLISGNVFYVALPRYKQLEIYPFDNPQSTKRHLDRILLGFGIATDQILQNYQVSLLEQTKDEALLRFIPKFEDDYGLEAILVWLNLESMRPRQLLIKEGEDETTITIKDFKTNPKIDKDRFEPKFPSDWERIERL